MLIRVGYELTINFREPTPVYLMLSVRPEYIGALEGIEQFRIEPYIEHETLQDCFQNTVTRFLAHEGATTVTSTALVTHSGLPEPEFAKSRPPALESMPIECMQFLMPSRYCQSDLLAPQAWELFGDIEPGWPRVQAVRDWVHSNVDFGYKYASSEKTALDVFREKTGVCRDFSHLCIALLRALNTPARYATGYLGDIGVPADPAPMDFSACFQVFLDGSWHIFDARHKQRRAGWILQAVGRDAADCAITTTFGWHKLSKFKVVAEPA